jgi:S-adenosylmethionine:tRNA ribosyltransferase-isomerase
MQTAAHSFRLPAQLLASSPPERRGIARDQVRLLVLERSSGRIHHAVFTEIGKFLNPGDLLVFNNSRTLPAVLNGTDAKNQEHVEVRLAEHLPDDSWYALIVSKQLPGKIVFNGRIFAEVLDPHPWNDSVWRIRFSINGNALLNELYRMGEPVRYEYVAQPWDLRYYQTVYALQPGSAEMPSAGRAFTWRMLFELKSAGIEIASVTLHTGLSFYLKEVMEPENSEEEFFVTESSAEKINRAIAQSRRVIAVGTSVVRALETAANNGDVQRTHDYTKLKITADSHLKIVNSLLTGFHEPEASHLDLLSAFLPASTILKEYEQALAAGYLWHEFGDLNLIL